MSVTVNVVGQTAVSVSVAASTSVSVVASGGIGPAGFITVPGTSTQAFGTFQLQAGDGITVSTANGQFLISSYPSTAVSSLAPVQSVAGRTGAVVLQAADVTAGTFAIGRIPTISYTALSGVPTAFTPASHTHDASDVASGTLSIARIPTISYTALSNVPATFAPGVHTHSTTDVVAFTAAAAAAAPVQSVNSKVGAVSLAAADVGAAAASHKHSLSDLNQSSATAGQVPAWNGTAWVATTPASGGVTSVSGRTGDVTLAAADVSGLAAVATSGSYTSLQNVPATFSPQVHTHSTADVVGLTASFSQVGHTHDYAATSHTHDAAAIASGVINVARLPANVSALNTLTGGITIAAGANVTVSTASSTITIAAGGGGGSGNIVEAATAAEFPSVGSAATLYHARDVRRIYFWDATAGVYAEAGPSGGGGSGGDGTDTVLRDLFKPAAPTSVTATAGNSQVALSWTAPTGVIAQAPITDYTVQVSSNSGTTWTTFSDGTSTATSATVTGLTNGTAYVFRVAAVNGVGAGAYSSATSSVTPGDVFRAIPAMTSNTAPSGEVTGVGNRGGDTDNDLWKAFDGVNSSSSWVYLNRAPSNEPKRRLQYAFPDGQKSRISGYSMILDSPSGGEYIPRQWGFYGSDDLSTWTQIETRTDSGTSGGVWFGTSITAGEVRTFTLPAVVNYRAYRWVFDETIDSGNAPGFREIALVQ